MKRTNADRVFVFLSLCGFSVAAVSFLLMSVIKNPVLHGSLFWGGLLVGIVFQVILEARRRALFASYHVERRTMQKPRCGLFTFASNKGAVLADVLFFAGIATTVLAFIYTKGTGYVCYIGISVTLLSFCMHCVLNGRNFFHANNQDRVRQVLEQKKANTIDKGEGENAKI